jgi:hypothetical protein
MLLVDDHHEKLSEHFLKIQKPRLMFNGAFVGLGLIGYKVKRVTKHIGDLLA